MLYYFEQHLSDMMLLSCCIVVLLDAQGNLGTNAPSKLVPCIIQSNPGI